MTAPITIVVVAISTGRLFWHWLIRFISISLIFSIHFSLPGVTIVRVQQSDNKRLVYISLRERDDILSNLSFSANQWSAFEQFRWVIGWKWYFWHVAPAMPKNKFARVDRRVDWIFSNFEMLPVSICLPNPSYTGQFRLYFQQLNQLLFRCLVQPFGQVPWTCRPYFLSTFRGMTPSPR